MKYTTFLGVCFSLFDSFHTHTRIQFSSERIFVEEKILIQRSERSIYSHVVAINYYIEEENCNQFVKLCDFCKSFFLSFSFFAFCLFHSTGINYELAEVTFCNALDFVQFRYRVVASFLQFSFCLLYLLYKMQCLISKSKYLNELRCRCCFFYFCCKT